MAKADGHAVGVERRRREERKWCWWWGGGTYVLVEITSSTPAPRSIATTEVKAPRGEGEEGGGGGGEGGRTINCLQVVRKSRYLH